MSGVEAIFGMAAGGAGLVSLGVQLSESAVKLRGIYHAAKDAPRIVSRLVFGLETMAMALRDLEQHRQQNSHSGALLARCITECQQSTAEIQQLVDKMNGHLAKHARVGGKLYAAFKERDMKELLDDLEKAKSSLELAYMMYLAEEQRRRDQAHVNTLYLHGNLLQGLQAQVSAGNANISQQLILLTQFSTPQQPHMLNSETQTATARELMSARRHDSSIAEKLDGLEWVSQYNRSLPVRQIKRKNSKARFRASIRLPTWLCRRVWEFAVTHAQCRWSMHLRTYNIVPDNSLIFHYCESGNLAKVRMLIESGEATPLDVTMLDEDYGGGWWTLLEVRP
jgi:Fungal N-terminal domain of STAND proteins